MMNLAARSLVFLGDMIPLFVIAFIQSLAGHSVIFAYIFLSVIFVSIAGNVYWLRTIKKYLNGRREYTEVIDVEDRSLVYTIYIVSYFSLIPIFTHSVYGLLSFVIIMLVIYSVYINSDIVFYNPVLALNGYKFYALKVKDKGSIYFLTKSKGIREGSSIEIHGITDFIYAGYGEDYIFRESGKEKAENGKTSTKADQT